MSCSVAVLGEYIKHQLMTESDMKVFELMYEQQPTRALTAKQLKWKENGEWLGWVSRWLGGSSDHADYNRKA